MRDIMAPRTFIWIRHFTSSLIPAVCRHNALNIWLESPANHICSRYVLYQNYCSTLDSTTRNKEELDRWRDLPPVPRQVAVEALIGRHNNQRIGDMGEGEEMRGAIKRLTAVRWVAKCCPGVPHSLINKLFRLRKIRLRAPPGGPLSEASQRQRELQLCRVSGKDVLREGAVLCLPASVHENHGKEGGLRAPGKITLEPTREEIEWLCSLVIYKDEEVIIINKPFGLAVQGGSEVTRSLDSMMGAALSYDYREGPRLVHRLDKETSGAMVVGRTHESTVFLHALLRAKTAPSMGQRESMERRYLALVMGTPEKSQGRISAPLAKVVTDSGKLEKMRVTHSNHPDAQEAITDYEVLGPSVCGCTWLELRPLTGRKHQLRVHCAEVLEMPIVGDYKYGWRAMKDWPPRTEGTGICCEGLTELKRDRVAASQKHINSKGMEKGSVLSSTPMLHLHCHRLILPNVAWEFTHQQKGQSNRVEDENGRSLLHQDKRVLDIVAPLPTHMLASWRYNPVPGITF